MEKRKSARFDVSREMKGKLLNVVGFVANNISTASTASDFFMRPTPLMKSRTCDKLNFSAIADAWR